MSLKEKDVLREMSENNPAVLLSVNDSCVVSDELFSGLDCSVNVSSPVKDSGKMSSVLKSTTTNTETGKTVFLMF